MKKIHVKFPDRRSIHLTLSYLAIIMILCAGFSVAFYQTSTKGLNLSLQASPSPETSGDNTNNLTLKAEDAGANNLSLAGGSSSSTSELNAQLEQQVQAFRQSLMQRLLLFNIGALGIGICLSYFLARRSLRPIEAAMELQERFSSDASHELRTPLAALRARSEVALKDPSLTLTGAKQVIKDDIEQAHKLELLAEGLLRLSREDSVQVRQAVSFQEIANEAMNTVILQAQSRHISIDEHVPHVQVLADRQALTQAIVVLIENAIKYSPERSAVRLSGEVEGSHVSLHVRDEGMGIDPKDLPHIFERFYRADASRSKPGHGLGLAITHKIITDHGGTITAASTVGTGSIFTIKLPLARP